MESLSRYLCWVILLASICYYVQAKHPCLSTLECVHLRPDCVDECVDVKARFHLKYQRCIARCNDKAEKNYSPPPKVKDNQANSNDKEPEMDVCSLQCIKKFIFLVETLDPHFEDDPYSSTHSMDQESYASDEQLGFGNSTIISQATATRTNHPALVMTIAGLLLTQLA
ncbi:hypothetical protein H4R33_005229 [Dimargaris cristalligena]|nr:hypothetical protein H4R33_005229 [Dimargaris cristalligena]